MQEATKHLSRSRASDRETQMAVLEQHCERIRRFNSAQDMLAADPAGAVTIFKQLLQEVPEQQVRGCCGPGFSLEDLGTAPSEHELMHVY